MKEIKEEKVKPKFDKGDWIIHQGTENIYQVVAIIDNQYQLKYGDNYTVQKCDDVDRHARLCITKENKELLLKDLCARLPYGVIVVSSLGFVTSLTLEEMKSFENGYKLPKPYLRPMSSITKEEMDKIEEILGDKCIFDFMGNGDVVLHQGNFTQNTLSKLYDFYNSIHVDYHTDDEGKTMIEKGLALEAPEGMYSIKEQ